MMPNGAPEANKKRRVLPRLAVVRAQVRLRVLESPPLPVWGAQVPLAVLGPPSGCLACKWTSVLVAIRGSSPCSICSGNARRLSDPCSASAFRGAQLAELPWTSWTRGMRVRLALLQSRRVRIRWRYCAFVVLARSRSAQVNQMRSSESTMPPTAGAFASFDFGFVLTARCEARPRPVFFGRCAGAFVCAESAPASLQNLARARRGSIQCPACRPPCASLCCCCC